MSEDLIKDLAELKELALSGELALGVGETIYMTFFSALLAYLIGLPLGVLLYYTGKNGIKPIGWINKPLGFIINVFRSLPFLILLVLIIPFAKAIVGKSFGIGVMIVALIIAAAPYVARMVESALNEVDKGVIEAAQSMGVSPLGLVFKVLLAESVPSLITGAVISTVTILGYSAMADTVAGGGLGKLAVIDGHAFGNKPIIWVCVVLTVIIVQIIQECGGLIARKIDKRIKN
ncbi:MAG: ABC transporter permease [Clostridia bacterium]|nr:ABC transporter permease [Clostridia bacterium]